MTRRRETGPDSDWPCRLTDAVHPPSSTGSSLWRWPPGAPWPCVSLKARIGIAKSSVPRNAGLPTIRSTHAKSPRTGRPGQRGKALRHRRPPTRHHNARPGSPPPSISARHAASPTPGAVTITLARELVDADTDQPADPQAATNTSFVNRFMDERVAPELIVTDPIEGTSRLTLSLFLRIAASRSLRRRAS